MAQDQNQSIEGPDITNYWQYFNLDRDPFAMTATDALIYLSSYWEETLDLIQYLVNYKNQLIVVTGSSGLGKTTLIDLLFDQLSETVNTAKITAEANLDVTRFVEFLSDAFTLPWRPDQSIEQVLDEQLQSFQSKERPCLLVIDNAHLLPTETLEALLYLIGQQSEHQMRFHAILVGDPALQQTLQRLIEPAEENLIHSLTLESLSLAETQLYLNHRLSVSGWQGESPMTDEIVARIYRLSEGNHARINRIARRVLLDMLTQQNNPSDATWWQRYGTRLLGAVLIVVLLLLVAIWLMRSNSSTLAAMPTTATQPTISVNGKTLNADQAQTVELPAPTAATESALNTAAHAPTPATDISPAAMAAVTAAPKVEPSQASIGAQIQAAPETSVATVASAPALSAEKAPVATPAGVNTTAAPTVTKNDNVAVVPPPVAASRGEAAAVPATSETAVTAAAATATAQVVVAPKAKHKLSKTEELNKKAEKFAQGGKYTIQLLNVSSEGSVSHFIKANHLEGKVTVKHVIQNGRTTTVVLYGRYRTMRDAERAVTTLPNAAMNAGPWPTEMP